MRKVSKADWVGVGVFCFIAVAVLAGAGFVTKPDTIPAGEYAIRDAEFNGWTLSVDMIRNGEIRVPAREVRVGAVRPELDGTYIYIPVPAVCILWCDMNPRFNAERAVIFVNDPELARQWNDSLEEVRQRHDEYYAPRDVVPTH